MAIPLLPHDFKEFLKLLTLETVEYLLIGGFAVAYHGYTRTTADIDIWISVHPDNATKLVRAIRQFGFDAESLNQSLFLTKNKIIRMGMPPFRIEILTGISGVDFEECYTERITANVDGIDINIINLKDLKINKKSSGRLKDLDDLEHL